MMLHDLREVLARYPATLRPLAVPEALGNAGGSSGARLWRYPSGQGTLVARAWPVDGPGRAVLRRIHAWLAATRDLGIIALPEADRAGETVQEQGGRLWDLSPWMPGEADDRRPPPRSRLRAGFIALASFHQALATTGGAGRSPGLTARLAEIDFLIRGGFEALGRRLGRDPGADAIAERARRWIDLARREVPRRIEALSREAERPCRLQACLRDARPEHFLFEEDRVVGMFDFGAMGLEAVSGDVARLLSEWVGSDRLGRAEALDAYATVRPLDEAETAQIEGFEVSAALLGAAHWIRWHFVEERRFEDPQAVARGIERGLERLSRLSASAAP